MTKASVFATLLPTMAVVVVAYLVTGIAMPVLPIYVHDGLGLARSSWGSLPARSSLPP